MQYSKEETTSRNTKMLVNDLSIQLAALGAYQQNKARPLCEKIIKLNRPEAN